MFDPTSILINEIIVLSWKGKINLLLDNLDLHLDFIPRYRILNALYNIPIQICIYAKIGQQLRHKWRKSLLSFFAENRNRIE